MSFFFILAFISSWSLFQSKKNYLQKTFLEQANKKQVQMQK